jgi:hypothetical protein
VYCSGATVTNTAIGHNPGKKDRKRLEDTDLKNTVYCYLFQQPGPWKFPEPLARKKKLTLKLHRAMLCECAALLPVEITVERGRDRRTVNARMTSSGARTLVRLTKLSSDPRMLRASLSESMPQTCIQRSSSKVHCYRTPWEKRPSRPSARTIVSGSFHGDSSSQGAAHIARHCLPKPLY